MVNLTCHVINNVNASLNFKVKYIVTSCEKRPPSLLGVCVFRVCVCLLALYYNKFNKAAAPSNYFISLPFSARLCTPLQKLSSREQSRRLRRLDKIISLPCAFYSVWKNRHLTFSSFRRNLQFSESD